MTKRLLRQLGRLPGDAQLPPGTVVPGGRKPQGYPTPSPASQVPGRQMRLPAPPVGGGNPCWYGSTTIGEAAWTDTGLPSGVAARTQTLIGPFDMRPDLGAMKGRNANKAQGVEWYRQPAALALGPAMSVIWSYPGQAELNDNAEDPFIRVSWAHWGATKNSESLIQVSGLEDITGAKPGQSRGWLIQVPWPAQLNFWAVKLQIDLVSGGTLNTLGPIKLDISVQ